jgi:NAD+ kinase
MVSQFKTVGIIGRVRSAGVKETLKTLIDFLHHLKQDFCVEKETAAVLDDATLPCVSREELGTKCNLIIVIGGDGSLLNAVHAAIHDEVPVLGINRGSLGFLTDIHPTDLSKIKTILEGQFTLEKRFLLTATIELQGTIIGQSDALNEVALIPDAVPHMNEFEVYIDKQFVCSQHSDGLIVATPTGSTAYALSGGGPILHPQLDALVIVPMFPHTLSIRPIVIDGNREVGIIVTAHNIGTPRLTCDGQTHINTPPGSHILIKKKSQRLDLVHPLDYDYYETLRSKLHWGRKLHYAE